MRLALLIIQLAVEFLRYLRDHRQRNLGRQEVINETNEALNESIAKAKAVSDALVNDPAYADRVRATFERPVE